jgi:uncharacterized RDD family membrane protein YckC
MTQSPDAAGGQEDGPEDVPQDVPPLTTPPPGAWHFPAEPVPPAPGQPGGPGGPGGPVPAGYGTSAQNGTSPQYGTSAHYGTPPPNGRPSRYGGQPGGAYAPYPGGPGGPVGPEPGLAEWWRRLLGRLIDVVAVAIVLLPISIPLLSHPWSRLEQVSNQYPNLNTSAAQNAFTAAENKFVVAFWTLGLIAAAVWFCYDAFQHAKWGQTLGKRVLSTRVVSAYDGSPITAPVAVRRAAVYALIPVIPLLGTFFALLNDLWLLWDRRRQCLHDKAARTIVIRTDAASASQWQQNSPW